MTRRPLRTTLFPYTTLFRSRRPPDDARGSEISAHELSGTDATLRQGDSRFRGRGVGAEQGEEAIDRCPFTWRRSEEHTSELQSRFDLVCRLLLEKKMKAGY